MSETEVKWPEQPKGITIRLEMSADARELASMPPENLHAFMEVVAKVLHASSHLPEAPDANA